MTDTAAIDAVTLPAAASEGTSAFVDGGAVLAVLPNVDAQQLDAAMDWLLFCQLAADRQFDRVADPDRWMAKFHDFMEMMKTGDAVRLQGTGSVADLIVDRFNGDGTDELSAALEAVANSGHGEAGQLLSRYAHRDEQVHLLVGVVSPAHGILTIDLRMVQYPVEASSGGGIVAADVSGKDVVVREARFRLNPRKAAELRDTVSRRLGMHSRESIIHVPLSA